MTDVAPRHVILVGLPGVGKSTVGWAVAERLGLPFVDLDEEIVRLDGRSIATIFEQSGEAVFRELEVVVTEAAMSHDVSIIASGGGWAANSSAVSLASSVARRIYLKGDPATVAARAALARGERPLLIEGDLTARIEQLLATRSAAYEASDAIVETERVDVQRVIHDVAALAAEWLRPHLGTAASPG